MIHVRTEHAAMCADFMLDQEPEDVAAPLYVLEALCYFRNMRKRDFTDTMQLSHAEAYYLDSFRAAIERWLEADPRACVAMLGPGLGIEQEEL